MDVDIAPALWVVVVGANVAIAALLMARFRHPAAVAVFGGWLAVAIALGASGVLEATTDESIPWIGLALVTPIVLGIWLMTRPGPVHDAVERIPLPWLIGVQVYRVVGAVFVVAWLQGDLPAVFAVPAGFGDIAVGLTAPFVAWRLARRPDEASSRRIAVAWNIAGIADLVVAVTMGVVSSPSPLQVFGADPNLAISQLPLVLVPLFAVPVSVLLHVAALRRLGSDQRMQLPVSAPGLRGASSTSRTSEPFRA